MVLNEEYELINNAIGILDHLTFMGALDNEEAKIIDKLCSHYEKLLDEKKEEIK